MNAERPTDGPGLGRERKRLALATASAFVAALLVLVLFVLPAEYGVDPTGVGRLVGLTDLAGRNGTTPAPDLQNVETSFVYQAAWSLEEAKLLGTQGYHRAGASQNFAVEVVAYNVTRVTARLAWTDANQTAGQPTDPDVFEVRVQSPDGARAETAVGRNARGGAGFANASLEWRQSPQPREVEANTTGDALRELLRSEPADGTARGTWRVNVTLVAAGGGSTGGLPLGGPAVDDGNDWTLEVGVETFRLDAQRLAEAVVRTDTSTIRLMPGKGTEFKLHINESQSVQYEWDAGRSTLYYDFHGEADEAGLTFSHKSGTAHRDQGELEAPFTGRHGWYWENRGPEEAVIELTTRGVYEVLGEIRPQG